MQTTDETFREAVASADLEMAGVPFVEWSQNGPRFTAQSSMVMSVEQCPLCHVSMSLNYDLFNEVRCANSHAFKFDNDGQTVTLELQRAAKAPQHVVAQTSDSGYEFDLSTTSSRNTVGCPLCPGSIPLLGITAMGGYGVDGFELECNNQHTFASYVRVPKLYLFETCTTLIENYDTPFETYRRELM
ncbi:hypothetical protein [Streptomyces sp. CoH17]|uniref:hypothetical protein n=1 Tax=Streptomyces sp. CoH17 TaxID=2992806 RepID=UPI00226E5A7C|nr:hypothetical protein [Streptomyces sp. CoH17]